MEGAKSTNTSSSQDLEGAHDSGTHVSLASKTAPRKFSPNAIIGDSDNDSQSEIEISESIGVTAVQDTSTTQDPELEDDMSSVEISTTDMDTDSAIDDIIGGASGSDDESVNAEEQSIVNGDLAKASAGSSDPDSPPPVSHNTAVEDTTAMETTTTYEEIAMSKNLDTTIKQDADDEDSDLSSVEGSPEPPSQELRELERRHEHKVECMHTDWCECPMHASYELDEGYPHLSEWALSHAQFPTSSMRTSHPELERKELLEKTQRKDINRISKSIVSSLVALQNHVRDSSDSEQEPDIRCHAAHALVEQINIVFYHSGNVQQILELVDKALRSWKRSDTSSKAELEKLNRRFAQAVGWRRELMYRFQKFLPEEFRLARPEKVVVKTPPSAAGSKRTSRAGREQGRLRSGRLGL